MGIPGPERLVQDRSGHCQTSTGEVPIAVGTAGPERYRASEYISDRMQDRMRNARICLPDRMQEYARMNKPGRMPEYFCQIECKNEYMPGRLPGKKCQIKNQNMCQIEDIRIYARWNARIYVR